MHGGGGRQITKKEPIIISVGVSLVPNYINYLSLVYYIVPLIFVIDQKFMSTNTIQYL